MKGQRPELLTKQNLNGILFKMSFEQFLIRWEKVRAVRWSLIFLPSLFFSSISLALSGPPIAWKSPSLDFAAVDFSAGNFIGGESFQLALASTRKIFLYSYPVISSSPVSVYVMPEGQSRILSLEASPLGAGAKAKLFVTYYDGALGQVGTRVFEFSLSQKIWKPLAQIPYVVRGIGGTGVGSLFCQQLLDNGSFPLSAIYPLTYKEGYSSADKSDKRVLSRWLYSQTAVHLKGQDLFAAIVSGNRLEISSKGKEWTIPGSYGQSPNRLRWPVSSSHILEFSPRILFKKGLLFVVKNESRWGFLAESFGLFDRGKISSLKWRDEDFERNWTRSFPGVVSDIDLLYPSGSNSPQLIALWTGSSKKTHLWAFNL